MFKSVRKRDGRIVPWDQNRITYAILKGLTVTAEGDLKDAEKISDRVVKELRKLYDVERILHIEEIQDVVETTLILTDYAKTAKAYILYREERARVREQRKEIPPHVKGLVTESKNYFRNPLAEFIFYRTYSRWIEDESRRETWIETVERYVNYMKQKLGAKLSDEEYVELHQAILKQEAMPSMRLMWGAGKAVENTNVIAYNCSFVAPTQLRDFAEILYLLMCGTGVGFTVEQNNVQQLPQIKRQNGKKIAAHAIEDSKEGWCDAFLKGLEAWFDGRDIEFDYSLLRPAGARLRTMGGRSSGPGPLRELLDFARRKILAKQGRRLSCVDVHDIICKEGEVVVMGGVRRSALISLSDLDDPDMRDAKTGQFYLKEPQRMMANNSAVYEKKPAATVFLDEWISLAKAGTGERGIFNRGGIMSQIPERRRKLMEEHLETVGSNPCGEILLRSKEFCNLTEVVSRAEDTEETLLRKVRLATILGTYQSTLTNFKYLSKEWKKNCEEERLLGVSITGQWDCPAVRNPETLRKLRERAIEVNREYAERFGISQSAAITCIKPSGTLSQLTDSASGMHPRHAPYYIRRVRISATEPLFRMLKDQKVSYHPEVGQPKDAATTYVFEFPVKAPDHAIFRNDLSAIEQLEYWKTVKTNYTEHNPSVTISIGEDEWIGVANWLYEHWDMLGGLAFLPREDHVYQLAPYEEIDQKRYEEMKAAFPEIDYSQILIYEKDDETRGSKELACVSGVCEIDEAPKYQTSS